MHPLLLLLAGPAAAEDLPLPLAYTQGARAEIEDALGAVEGWIAAARKRDDLDERLCLQAKLTPMHAYAASAAGATVLLRERLALGDDAGVALEVRKVSVAVDRARRLHDEALACLRDKAPELSAAEDPDLFRHETDLGARPFLIEPDPGDCGDEITAASPC